MTVIERHRAKLAVGAALNSTTLYQPGNLENPEHVRQMLLHELSDWFALSPVEAGQFDQPTTLEYVRSEPLGELIGELDEMGKNPFSASSIHCIPDDDGTAVHKWDDYMERQSKKVLGMLGD